MVPKKVAIKSFPQALWVFICGLLMGSADVVPGISGGTMAFILGIYEDLIGSIRSVKFQALSKISWEFLLLLISGIAFAFLNLASVFDAWLKDPHERVLLYSTFMGLILGSVYYLTKQMKGWRQKDFLALLLAAIIAFLLTMPSLGSFSSEKKYDVFIKLPEPAANYSNGMLLNVSKSNLEVMLAKGWISEDTILGTDTGVTLVSAQNINPAVPRLDLWALLCGMIAISAMLLPGISGSYLLNILGMYAAAIAALSDVMAGFKKFTIDWEPFMLLLSIGIGILLGAALFSRVIGWLLTRYHALAIAMLTGFMLGALQTVWPFWSYEYKYNPLKLNHAPELSVIKPILPAINSEFFLALGFVALGFIAVLTIEYLAHLKKKHL